jgi:hypothetical protein
MEATQNALCAVLLGTAGSEERAAQAARVMQGCPYVVQYTATGKLITGVFSLPAEKEWWIRGPEDKPELLGLERVRVFLTGEIQAESPWSRGDSLPKLEQTPCGSDCRECPFYGSPCEGCPSSVFYGRAQEYARRTA